MQSSSKDDLPLQTPLPPSLPSSQGPIAFPRYPTPQHPHNSKTSLTLGITPTTTSILSEGLKGAAPCPRTAALTAEIVDSATARPAPPPTAIDSPAWPQSPNLYGQRRAKICMDFPTDKQLNEVWHAGKAGRDYLRYSKGASWGGRVAKAQPEANAVVDEEVIRK
jgi:hypothetical protein